MTFTIEFAAAVEEHLRALSARDRAVALAAIQRSLTHEPLSESRNRKPLRPNPIAPWELREGKLRVFYEVDVVAPTETGSCESSRWDGNVLLIGRRKIRL